MAGEPITLAMRASGKWNEAWDGAAMLDPEWMEKFIDMATLPVRKGLIDPKTYEYIAIAVDASCTHLYSPGVRRHVAKALELGAAPQEVLAVLQAVAALGIHSVALGAPILMEEMTKRGMTMPTSQGD